MANRNPEIQKIFEITDDALQGLIGFHLFVDAAVSSSPDELIRNILPTDRILITPDWVRFYDREELLLFMRRYFTPIFFRNLFVSLVGYFDAATEDFLEYLRIREISCDHNHKERGYQRRLEWVFRRVKDSKFGTQEMINEIPNLCLNADHSRRLRNIIVHNQGCINKQYKDVYSDVGQILGRDELKPIFDLAIENYNEDKLERIPVIVTYNQYCLSLIQHIRLLHFLHNEIQFQYFDCCDGYEYRKEHKKIEWHRVFFGA
jgi:hypothetical protein